MDQCIFCSKNKFDNSLYENTVFNNKEFKYIVCKNCKLVMLSPLPDTDDYDKMYPVAYQGEFDTKKSTVYDSIISKIKSNSTGTKILDYGCGNGRFIKELDKEDFEIWGTEFNKDMVALLKDNFPHANFLTIDKLLEDDSNKFDIIFLSNVLEHLTNPGEIIDKLRTKLSNKGIFVIEGPLEEQINTAYLFRKLVFGIRKTLFNSKAKHIPYHIFRSGYRNQLNFFETRGLATIEYHCMESPWPFPSTLNESKSFNKKMQYMIGQLSMSISKANSKWGNNFFYIGKLDTKK